MTRHAALRFGCLLAVLTLGCGGDVERSVGGEKESGEHGGEASSGGSEAEGGRGGTSGAGMGGSGRGGTTAVDSSGGSSTVVIECPGGFLVEVTAPVCGDGALDVSELCDDGNVSSGDGCNSQCRIEPGWICLDDGKCLPCGNCTLDEGEECDDGNQVSGDGCSELCQTESGYLCKDAGDGNGTSCFSVGKCGDGTRSLIAEECDDGNTVAGDGCSPSCRVESGWSCTAESSECQLVTSLHPHCGDGVVQSEEGETCDDGRQGSCNAVCQLPSCGDGEIQRENGEACDDGVNDASYGACRSDCTMPLPPTAYDCGRFGPTCGDRYVEPGYETCDDGINDGLNGHCNTNCSSSREGYCGDGTTDPPYEECDDGNWESCDGCTALCQKETVLVSR
jgi:cysteine-rich repeat protein